MQYDCELVLRENGGEIRVPHTFLAAIRPGTFLRLEGRDWIVIEVQESETPVVVVCRPPNES